jgi:predicted RNase H-like HicB family nuclease
MTEAIRDAFRDHLSSLRPCDAVVVADGDGWSAYLPGLPFFTAHGADRDEVVDDLVVALREYAEDWNDHLHDAPNHQDHWAVVALTKFSTDEQLRAWLVAGEASDVA